MSLFGVKRGPGLPAFIAITYLVGGFVAYPVFLNRAGFWKVKGESGVDWREFLLPNIGFFLLLFGKAVGWPVVLVVWLATGRQPSPWAATIRDGTGRSARSSGSGDADRLGGAGTASTGTTIGEGGHG